LFGSYTSQEIFLATWRRQGGPVLTRHDYLPHVHIHDAQIARAIASEAGGEPNPVYVTLISVIRNAQRSV
jgi:hypothetical protein